MTTTPRRQDLPEWFEDHIKEWMECFVEGLKYTNPQLAVDDDEVARQHPNPNRTQNPELGP